MRFLLRKTSLVDYPGKVAAVCFVRGCNLRCPWCHNPDLVVPSRHNRPEDSLPSPLDDRSLSREDILAFLKKRRPVLGGAVISGGEPCLWEELPGFIRDIKDLGLPVKLDTNGAVPAMLEKTFSREAYRPDYIALDLKLAPRRYGELLIGHSGPSPMETAANLERSAALLGGSGIAHEYRTLVLPGGSIGAQDIEELAPLADGAPWYFRPFRGGNCLDPAWDTLTPPGPEDVRALAETARKLGKNGIPAEAGR